MNTKGTADGDVLSRKKTEKKKPGQMVFFLPMTKARRRLRNTWTPGHVPPLPLRSFRSPFFFIHGHNDTQTLVVLVQCDTHQGKCCKRSPVEDGDRIHPAGIGVEQFSREREREKGGHSPGVSWWLACLRWRHLELALVVQREREGGRKILCGCVAIFKT